MTRLEKIKDLVPQEHYDVYLNTLRTVEMIDNLQVSHNELVAAQALAGISPDGEDEALLRETLATIRSNAIAILEKELEDWQHKGDKNYVKHFV